jgi:beta-glucanase (GH16 family)
MTNLHRPLVAICCVLAACGRGVGAAPGQPTPLAAHGAAAPAAPLPGYRLAWHDEFDGTTLDTAKWTAYAGARRGALNAPDAVAVAGGVLTLAAYTEGGVHSVGFIDTARKFLATYGWLEARIRFVSAPGEWGAFWLQSPTMGNPVGDVGAAGAEIDVAEHRATDTAGVDISNSYGINLHWDGYGASHRHAGGVGAPPPGTPPLQGSWHTYAVHWTADGYIFYLDGVRQWATAEGLSRRPQFIKLTCEVQDGGWAGHIPPVGYGPRGRSTTGMQVDWVRVWVPAP